MQSVAAMARLDSLLPYHYMHLNLNFLKNIKTTRMRQQRVWGFFQGWLPLSALPMILPFSTNQQPLKNKEIKNFSFWCSLHFASLIQQQQQHAQCDPLSGIWGGWGVHRPYPYLG